MHTARDQKYPLSKSESDSDTELFTLNPGDTYDLEPAFCETPRQQEILPYELTPLRRTSEHLFSSFEHHEEAKTLPPHVASEGDVSRLKGVHPMPCVSESTLSFSPLRILRDSLTRSDTRR